MKPQPALEIYSVENTLAKTEIIYLKNVGALVAMNFA